MIPLRPLAALLPALLILSACAGPQGGAPSAPAPATRFEGGGGEKREIAMHQDQQDILGVWQGPFVPMDMALMRSTGGPAGVATLSIGEVEGSLAHGLMSWKGEDGQMLWPAEKWVGALTVTGHFMVRHAHFIMHTQDGVRYIEADMLLPDGGFYRHRLVQVEGGGS